MTTTMAEPEWDEDTRNLALAFDDVNICPICGGPAALCQDPARQDDWVAQPPVRCHRKTAILQRQSSVTEETNAQMQALLWPVVLLGGERGGRS